MNTITPRKRITCGLAPLSSMLDLQKLQKDIYANKIEKGFNVTDMALEFSLTHEELSEAFHAYRKKLPDV